MRCRKFRADSDALTQIAGFDAVFASFHFRVVDFGLQFLFLGFELFDLIFQRNHVVALSDIDTARGAGIFGFEVFELGDAFVDGLDSVFVALNLVAVIFDLLLAGTIRGVRRTMPA
jgi:hypothetical protein